MSKDFTREAWLEALIYEVRPVFAGRGYPLPDDIRVAVGWPFLAKRGPALGECWVTKASEAHATEIFISPKIGDGETAARVLTHELCHAAVGAEQGHKRAFAQCGAAMDLEGKPKNMIGEAKQWEWLGPIVESLGEFPHSALNEAERAGEKKQTTRMIKVSCPCCGFTMRTTARWLEGKTELRCPDTDCGATIELEDSDG